MKAIGIIILGILICNVTFAKDPGWIKKGKLKIGMSAAEVGHILYWSAPWDDKRNPTSKGCINEYYKESKQEILIPRSKDMYYVFKDVTLPTTVGEKGCELGNGTLQAYTYSHADALALIEAKKTIKKKSAIKKSSIEEFKEICTGLGLTHGTSGYVDCVLKLKSDEEKMIMESQRLETEENIAKEKQKTAQDKQGLEQEKYDDEEGERKQKKYEECLEETSQLYGEPKLFRCSLELL